MKQYKDMDLKEFFERGQIIEFRIKTCKDQLEKLEGQLKEWELENQARVGLDESPVSED